MTFKKSENQIAQIADINADFRNKSFFLNSFLLTVGFVNGTMIVHIPGEPILHLLFQLHMYWCSHSDIHKK